MTERELHRRIRRELRALDIQPPLSVTHLCAAFGESRGRRIELRPFPLPKPGPLGLWFELPQVDLVLYQQETTRLHQDHIVLHEVMGHILGDHGNDSPAGLAEQYGHMVPGVKASAIRRVMGRCSYDDGQECEAELAATIILEWASVLDHVSETPAEDPSVRRIHSALGDNRGWL
ncbi:hypothetical protein [Streptomyces sp. NPDC001889]